MRHESVSAQQIRFPEHISTTVGTHAPAPSHSSAATFFPMQCVSPHVDPAGVYSHAPSTHAPVVPHVPGAWAGQSSEGSVRFVTLAHCPLGAPVSALLHAWHGSLHGAAQQYPSTHGAPSGHDVVQAMPTELDPTWH